MQNTKLKSHKIISKIITLFNESKESKDFHKKSGKLLSHLSEPFFIFKVFEINLLNESFLFKKWKTTEIPKLSIYEDENISIDIHFFSPSKNSSPNEAAYLIHHHQNYILSSYVHYGRGYHTLEFEKDIKKNSSSNFHLRIDKDFFHRNGNLNMLDSFKPHVVFNVEDFTSTIVLWSQNKNIEPSKINDIRTNYYLKNGTYFKINEIEFNEVVSNYNDFEFDSENHIQSICYFLQNLNYRNKKFIRKILSLSNVPFNWKKNLEQLIYNKHIKMPLINNSINNLKNKINLNDFRSYDSNCSIN